MSEDLPVSSTIIESEKKKNGNGKNTSTRSTCPICSDPKNDNDHDNDNANNSMPALSWRLTERTRLVCCGTWICPPCGRRLLSNDASDKDDNDNADTRDSIIVCPLCQGILPSTPKDSFEMLLRHQQNHPTTTTTTTSSSSSPWAWVQNDLGTFYQKGGIDDDSGVVFCSQDFVLAFDCHKAAAELGHVMAQHVTGDHYRLGIGVEKSNRNAIYWYEKAAATNNNINNSNDDGDGNDDHGNGNGGEGLALSQHKLGDARYDQENYKEAVRLYALAAHQDYGPAQACLAQCYEQGLGVEAKSLTQSLYWNERAAGNGDALGMGNYARNLLDHAEDSRIVNFVPEVLFWARKSIAIMDADIDINVDVDNGGGADDGVDAPNNMVAFIAGLEEASSLECRNCQFPAKYLTEGTKFQKCTRCKAAYYCHRNCQKTHWKQEHQWDCVNDKGEKKIKPGATT